MKDILKQAILKFLPEYLDWDLDQQERFRVNTPKDIDFNIKQFLLEKKFNIKLESAKEIRNLPLDILSEYNEILLPIMGVGDDYIFLNEGFSENKSILSFPTLYDYDFDDFQFQEKHRVKDIEGYEKKKYYGSLNFSWSWMLLDQNLIYANLSMMANYVTYEIKNFGDDLINQLIPNELKPGKDHMKKTPDGNYRFDMEWDAGGSEAELKELKEHFFKYQETRQKQLEMEFDQEARQQVFLVKVQKEITGDLDYEIIFTDQYVLPTIRFKKFIADCRKIEQPDHSKLMDRIEKEKEITRDFITNSFKQVSQSKKQ